MRASCPECGREPLYRWDCIRCAQLFRRPRRYWEHALAKLWAKDPAPAASHLILAREIRRLHASGRTAASVAAELGLTISRLNNIRREIGLSVFVRPETRGRPSTWTPDQAAALAMAVASGMTKLEFAAQIGRTEGAVESRRRIQKLPPFKICKERLLRRTAWPAARIETLRQLRAERFSFSECAVRLNTTRGAVARSVQKYLKESANA